MVTFSWLHIVVAWQVLPCDFAFFFILLKINLLATTWWASRVVARKKILHYHHLYIDRPDPIAFMPDEVDTSGRIYDDFLRLLFVGDIPCLPECVFSTILTGPLYIPFCVYHVHKRQMTWDHFETFIDWTVHHSSRVKISWFSSFFIRL